MKNNFSENTPCVFKAAIGATRYKKIPPNKWREITITKNSVKLGRFIWDSQSKSYIKWNILTNKLSRLERIYDDSNSEGFKVYWKLIGPNLNLTLYVDARYPQMIEDAMVSK